MLGKVYSLNGGQGEDPCFTSHKQIIQETVGAFQGKFLMIFRNTGKTQGHAGVERRPGRQA